MSHGQALLAVIIDLWEFLLFTKESTYPEMMPASEATSPLMGTTIAAVSYLPKKRESLALPGQKPILHLPEKSADLALQSMSERTAYIATREATISLRPLLALDTIVGKVGYGVKVSALSHQGRYTLVRLGKLEGWVMKDHLVYEADLIYPSLVQDTVYGPYDEVTEKVRRAIDDSFGAADLFLPLLAQEYVTYRLHLQSQEIPWPLFRPREVGRWSEYLKGLPGIHVDITPRTGAIMEWNDENMSHLLYVEAVHPDVSIVTAGIVDELGLFKREEVSAHEVLNRQGVFISLV